MHDKRAHGSDLGNEVTWNTTEDKIMKWASISITRGSSLMQLYFIWRLFRRDGCGGAACEVVLSALWQRIIRFRLVLCVRPMYKLHQGSRAVSGQKRLLVGSRAYIAIVREWNDTSNRYVTSFFHPEGRSQVIQTYLQCNSHYFSVVNIHKSSSKSRCWDLLHNVSLFNINFSNPNKNFYLFSWIHLTGRTLTSDWLVNRFIMVSMNDLLKINQNYVSKARRRNSLRQPL